MPTIALEKVGLAFGARQILADADAVFAAGECTAVAGASGTGKTSLLRLLNRFGEPDTGRILLDATPITEMNVLELRRRVGLVPQRPILLTDIVREEVRVGRAVSDERVGELLTAAGLTTEFAGRRCAELSGGEAQRVCLARSLAVEPDILLLDEPTSALDGGSAEAIATLIRRHVGRGGSVVLVSHDRRFTAAVSDQVWMLEQGRLVHRPESGKL